jgi:DNA repair protein RadA/Sms
VLSSDIDRPIPKGNCFAGEIGLSGEIRLTGRLDQRIAEAAKLGYKRIFVPAQKNSTSNNSGIEVIEVQKVEQVFSKLFS